MSEQDDIRTYSKGQKARLKRHECGLCNMRLDRAGCQAIYAESRAVCTLEVRRKRRADCLKSYKPRSAA